MSDDIAARRALRRQIMAASAARRPKRVRRPQPPNAIILAHTRFMLAVSKDMDRAIYAMLREEGLFRADAAERDLDSLEAQMRRRLAKITSRKNLVGAIDDLGLRAKRYTRTEWQKQLHGAMGIDLTDPNLAPMLESFRKRQGDLITSLAADKIARVKRILRQAGANARVEDITKLIREQTGATQSRAALIARTEATTLTSKMTQARHVAAGIHSYTVSTSQDERVRESHRALEGMRFEYGKPPIVDGEPFVPGQTFNCRCVAIPVLPGEDE